MERRTLSGNKPGGFELSKWYGDCIAECGDVRIAYNAQVRYGHLKVSYASLLDGEGASHSLRRGEIAEEGQTLSWVAPGLTASWTRQDAELRATVLDRKSTRLNSSHLGISYAVFCLKK